MATYCPPGQFLPESLPPGLRWPQHDAMHSSRGHVFKVHRAVRSVLIAVAFATAGALAVSPVPSSHSGSQAVGAGVCDLFPFWPGC